MLTSLLKQRKRFISASVVKLRDTLGVSVLSIALLSGPTHAARPKSKDRPQN